MGDWAAAPPVRNIMTRCHIRAATAKAAQRAPEGGRSRRVCAAGSVSRAPSIRSAKPGVLGMTIVQEITFAVLAAVGAVAGSEVIVRLWHVFQVLF